MHADTTLPGRAGIAVDIGGSKIATAESHRPDTVHRIPTQADRGADEVANRVVAAIRMWDVSDRDRIVVATAGDLDRSSGRVVSAANLPWRDFPLVDAITDATGCSVDLIGDATAATLAELTHHSRSRHRNGIYVTVSTGIGMGAMREGRLDWSAGIGRRELGHVRVDSAADAELCGCGRRGCLEAYSSGRAIARRYRRSIGTGRAGREVTATDMTATDMTATEVIDAAGRGDRIAQRCVADALDHLTRALAAAVEDVDATVVVLGGGVMAHTDLIESVRSGLRTLCGPEVAVERSVFGSHSTIQGAAALCERAEPVMEAWGHGGR